MIECFDDLVIDKLQAYVYRLEDPRNGKTFYVGKGTGNRVFAHARAALKHEDFATVKLELISEILKAGLRPRIWIHRHGMDDKLAHEVEADLIDAYPELTNMQGGHYGENRGLMGVEDVVAQYGAKPARIAEPSMLIKINRRWPQINEARKNGATDQEYQNALYEATRKRWVVGVRRDKAKYAFSVALGIIRQVYEIDEWRRSEGKRFEFVGRISSDLQCYKLRSVKGLVDPGAQNPIKYLNC